MKQVTLMMSVLLLAFTFCTIIEVRDPAKMGMGNTETVVIEFSKPNRPVKNPREQESDSWTIL